MVIITKVCWGNQYNVKIELYDLQIAGKQAEKMTT